jgi:hypothetical protein
MENQTFTYSYSATQTREVEEIRKRYVPEEQDKMERLRRLDAKVQNAGMVESLCVGIIGLLIFGVAMCFGLGVFATAWWPAIPIGIVGIAVMSPAYPLYQYLYQKKKAELTPEILRLSEELIGK